MWAMPVQRVLQKTLGKARNLQNTRFDYFSADTVSVTLDCIVCISVELHSWATNTAFFLSQ